MLDGDGGGSGECCVLCGRREDLVIRVKGGDGGQEREGGQERLPHQGKEPRGGSQGVGAACAVCATGGA
jgi:hypothetical protein